MNIKSDTLEIINELSKNCFVFEALLKDLNENLYLWKPSPEKWCLLEIICHLYDEEREDFRARTKHVLETPELELPPIDPEGWVLSRKYVQQNYNEMLISFLKERDQSVKFLLSLSNPNWDNAFEHSKFGKLTAKMFLTNWLAHDYLHIRQIIKLKYDYFKELTSESLIYAGKW